MLMSIVEKLRRMFDLDANMTAIHEVLNADDLLARSVAKHPGLRLPGAWDPLEAAIRAVVGQQVSVKGARTVLGRIAAKAGPGFESGDYPELTRFFPTAHELATADLKAVGTPEVRIRTIQALAQEVDRERLAFVVKGSLSDLFNK